MLRCSKKKNKKEHLRKFKKLQKKYYVFFNACGMEWIRMGMDGQKQAPEWNELEWLEISILLSPTLD
jgi:hypothetical protein